MTASNGKSYCRDGCLPENRCVDRFLSREEAGKRACANCGVILAPQNDFLLPWKTTIIGAR